MDGGGDILDDHVGDGWWEHPREQQSYYLGESSTGLTLLGRDFSEPLEAGFGELYRAATYFLGWHGSRHASKVTALSAYGRQRNWPRIFEQISDGSLRSPLRNDPYRPLAMISELAGRLDVDIGEPREPEAEILQIHKDFAAWVQFNVEQALLDRVVSLGRELEVEAICLSGGVALNVLANGHLHRHTDFKVYVPPAPADDGQALGNALASWWMADRGRDTSPVALRQSSDAALGPEQSVDSASVSAVLRDAGRSSYVVCEYTTSAPVVAACLASGSTVCVYQSRGEYGPRALGQRSILCDPRRGDLRALMNTIKSRDWFMPFAPTAVLDGRSVADWFETSIDSPFMSFAVPVRAERRDQIRAVLGEDGTARVQTIAPDDPSFIAEVVREFGSRTGIPLILNTSFNTGGRPIVETSQDAVSTFAGMPINLLVLGRFVVIKNLSPELVAAGVMPDRIEVAGRIVTDDGVLDLELPRRSARQAIRRVQEATGAVVFVRSELPLYGPYLDWLREGRKVTTIRFRKGGVEIPSFAVLPLFKTEDYGVGDRSTPVATVRITGLRYQRFGGLTEADAERDGFASLEHMRRDLGEIYPTLGDNDWVTIYEIGIADAQSSVVSTVQGSPRHREPVARRSKEAVAISRAGKR